MILRQPITFPHLIQGILRSFSTSFVSRETRPRIEFDPLPLPRSINPSNGLLLFSIPIAPVHWPSKLILAPKLLSSLIRRGIAVNAIYDGIGDQTTFRDDDRYPARLFYPDGKSFKYQPGELDVDVDGVSIGKDGFEYVAGKEVDNEGKLHKEILVCTHGSRDCRCSDRGGPLVDALRAEIRRRDLDDEIKVSEIAHVGGHKWAANAILIPSLDMLSNLTAEHAPALISHIINDRPKQGPMWNHWRGRYGLSELQQEDVWRRLQQEVIFGADTKTEADVAVSGAERKKVEAEVSVHGTDATEKTKVMLRFKTWEGEVREVDASLGQNLLQVGKDHDLPALEGVCGGNLECATCHLYLATSSTAGPAPVSEPKDEELDMLGYAVGYRDGQSRLGCQIKVTEKLAEWVEKGGIIALPRF
ncbi:Sucrase/ferredoxin-like-domain-containing protein [Naematelia encephala]|uniref:Sucrase/ferredoxin-like-domain-containing protein n=1 Tax=Naematelia encephala TaxID=71784 RepID=A0A1Y2AW63_9TREE|nr:Sucrase/ferredoxin-like-domain-containing protein [Naematelia encephala]